MADQDQYVKMLIKRIQELRKQDLSYAQIAQALRKEKATSRTIKGKLWERGTVERFYKRYVAPLEAAVPVAEPPAEAPPRPKVKARRGVKLPPPAPTPVSRPAPPPAKAEPAPPPEPPKPAPAPAPAAAPPSAFKLDQAALSDLEEMLAWWRTRRGSTSLDAGGPRPVLVGPKRNTGVWINEYVLKKAKARVLKEKTETGGSISSLVELLLWKYIGSPVQSEKGKPLVKNVGGRDTED